MTDDILTRAEKACEGVTATLPGPCDRCGRHRDHLHRTPLGWVCAPCILGNPDIANRRRKTLRSKRKEVAEEEWLS